MFFLLFVCLRAARSGLIDVLSLVCLFVFMSLSVCLFVCLFQIFMFFGLFVSEPDGLLLIL